MLRTPPMRIHPGAEGGQMVAAVGTEPEIGQVEDDIKLLYRMLADMTAAAPIYQPTHYWAAYEPFVIARLREGLRDFRRGPDTVLEKFGATDAPPTMLDILTNVPKELEAIVAEVLRTVNQGLVDDYAVLPCSMRMSDLIELAYTFCQAKAHRSPHIASIDDLDVSRVGNPHGFGRDGRFLTRAALSHYLRYAFVAEHLDLRNVDVVVELGSGSGAQVEVLKQLHPHLSLVLLDLAPQLYVAERYLCAVYPDAAVPYDETRRADALRTEPGRIYFAGNHRIGDVAPHGRTLFWNAASFGEMEPAVVANYAELVSPIADWLYLCQCFTGKERAREGVKGGVLEPVVWSHYVAAFAAHQAVARRPSHTGFAPLVEGSCAYEDTFWVRNDD
jgi:putative sugar O-methyltransferase